MKKMNKKGFTIVELVIVIAVIAILSAVMIPTFSGIVKSANQSAAAQAASAAFKEAYALDLADGIITTGTAVEMNGFTFTFTTDAAGALDDVEIGLKAGTDTATKYAGYTFEYTDGGITASKS